MTRIALTLAAFVALLPAVNAGALPTWTYQHDANVAIRDGADGGGLSLSNAVPVGMTGAGLATLEVVQWSIAGEDAPDTVKAQPFEFSLGLTDQASQASGLATFTGTVSGSYWKGGAALTGEFTGDTVRTLTLGDYDYTVTLVDFTPPTVAGVEGVGRITARVDVNAADGETPTGPVVTPEPEPQAPAETPEPATVLLAVGGLGVVSARRLVRRRTAG